MAANNRIWRSSLAQTLLISEGGITVEEAALHLIDRRLAMLKPLKPPVDLPMVASIMGISANFNYVEMTQSARIVERDGKHYIDVNKRHAKQRQRFSIAHEIAHKMLAGKKISGAKARNGVIETTEDDEEELLCDLIAGYLLGLREDILLPILLERNFSFDTIQFVATTFQTSFEATTRALLNCFDGNAAVLYCIPEENPQRDLPLFFLRRYYPTPTFPVTFYAGQAVPRFICLNRAFLSDTLIKTVESVSFDNVLTMQYQCEAKKMTVYMEGTGWSGVVMLLRI